MADNVDAYLGEIRMFGGDYAPQDWLPCDGRLVAISTYDVLYALIGTTYGGDGQTTFALPDMRGRLPIGEGSVPGLTPRVPGQQGGSETVTLTVNTMPAHTHAANAVNTAGTQPNPTGGVWAATVNTTTSTAVNQYIKTSEIVPPAKPGVMDPRAIEASGGNAPHSNMMPFLSLNFIICILGTPPKTPPETPKEQIVVMEPYLGEIALFPYNKENIPKGWLPCDGCSLTISQHMALYSLLGTAYGGDGINNFNLPDLRGRMPVHPINDVAQSEQRISINHGKQSGAETVAINASHLPSHTHQVNGENALGDSVSPIANDTCLWAIPADSTKKQVAVNPFSTATPNARMDASAIAATGGGQGHDNMQPFLVLNYCIAIVGIYPIRDDSEEKPPANGV